MDKHDAILHARAGGFGVTAAGCPACEARRVMESVLITHQRATDTPGRTNVCTCGWHRLGYSFPGHQAEQILNALLGRRA